MILEQHGVDRLAPVSRRECAKSVLLRRFELAVPARAGRRTSVGLVQVRCPPRRVRHLLWTGQMRSGQVDITPSTVHRDVSVTSCGRVK